MRECVDAPWRRVLEHNRLPDFTALWGLAADWFEPPNERRGGWSGVARIQLKLPEGGEIGAFLKRQENHTCRTWRHPVRGEPTFAREYANIIRLRELGIPTLEPLYFGEALADGKRRAVLLTRALDGYEAFGSGQFAPDSAWMRAPANRHRLIRAVAGVVRCLHACGLQHNCLYPKHLLIREDAAGDLDVRLIDLEKLQRRFGFVMRAAHDLGALNRHSPGWRASDRALFLLAYLGERRHSARARRLMRRLAKGGKK